MTEKVKDIEIKEKESLNTQQETNNESEKTQVNNLIVVNKARPDILVDKSREIGRAHV